VKGRIEKIYTSTRIGSSLDHDLSYEFLHVRLEGGEDAVVIQMVRASQPGGAMPPRIPLKDLKLVEEALLIFMEGVRKKSGDVTSLEQAFFTMGVPGIKSHEEEHAVFRAEPAGSKQASRPSPESEGILISSGPRKGFYDPKAAAAAAAEARAASGEGKPSPEEPPPKVMVFTLAHPPTVEEVVKELQADMKRLVVVARKEIAAKVQAYLDGVMAGNKELTKKPGEFEAVVVPRKGGKSTLKMKMGAPLAHGILEIVANPSRVLWIPPEEK
jgi:hypothetical protein